MLVPRISRRSFPKSSSDASRRLETTRSAEKLGTAPVDQHFIGYSLISANISDFPLTVSVVVSVRESKLIRQQCLSASLAACIPAVRYGPELISTPGSGGRVAHFQECMVREFTSLSLFLGRRKH